MANADTPKGLVPVEYLNGSPWNGQVHIYYVPSTDGTIICKGDPVKSAGAADTLGIYATVTRGAATNTLRGVAVGFGDTPNVNLDTTNLARKYRPASTAMYVAVVDDPHVIFEMQEDSSGANLAAANVGQCADVVIGSGNTTTGLSTCEIDSDSPSSTSSAQVRILGLVNRVDNAMGTNAKWRVLINEHELKGTGTAGV